MSTSKHTRSNHRTFGGRLLRKLTSRPPIKAGSRIAGIDVARSAAMIGMLVAHTVSPQESGGDVGSASNPPAKPSLSAVPAGFDTPAPPAKHAFSWDFLSPLYDLVAGRAQATFVILAGLMVGMMAMRATTKADRRSLRGKLVVRGLLLLLIGVAMESAGMSVVQILTVYGVYFIVSPLLLTISRRSLLIASATMAVLGPVILFWMSERGWLSLMNVGSAPSSSSQAVEASHWHLLFSNYWDTLTAQPSGTILSGTYPVLPEIALFLFGMALGRTKLSADGVARRLATGGLIAVVALPTLATMAERAFPGNLYAATFSDITGHSGKTASLLYGMAVASTVLGLAILVVRRWPRATRPLALLGTWSLTFYLVHALWLTNFRAFPWTIEIGLDTPTGPRQLITLLLWLSIPAAIIAAAALTRRKGPAESLIFAATKLVGARRGSGSA